MRVRLQNKPKPNNYTESCGINMAGGWGERLTLQNLLKLTSDNGIIVNSCYQKDRYFSIIIQGQDRITTIRQTALQKK